MSLHGMPEVPRREEGAESREEQRTSQRTHQRISASEDVDTRRAERSSHQHLEHPSEVVFHARVTVCSGKGV